MYRSVFSGLKKPQSNPLKMVRHKDWTENELNELKSSQWFNKNTERDSESLKRIIGKTALKIIRTSGSLKAKWWEKKWAVQKFCNVLYVQTFCQWNCIRNLQATNIGYYRCVVEIKILKMGVMRPICSWTVAAKHHKGGFTTLCLSAHYNSPSYRPVLDDERMYWGHPDFILYHPIYLSIYLSVWQVFINSIFMSLTT